MCLDLCRVTNCTPAKLEKLLLESVRVMQRTCRLALVSRSQTLFAEALLNWK